MKSTRLYYLVFLAFFVLFLFYFFSNIVSGQLFCYRDIGRYYYPTRFVAAESLIKGDFPLWNPYIFCGYPSFASLQQATLYPLSLLYFLFPFFSGFNYFFLLHIFIAALAVYLLLRKLQLSVIGSFTGAVCFSFCGYTVSMINLVTTLSAIVWLPLAMLFMLHFTIGQKKIWLFICSMVLSLQFFAGQPEIVFLSFIALIMTSFYLISRKRDAWRVLLLVFIFFLGITAVQLFPFLELMQNSERIFTGNILKKVWSFHPLEMMNFVIPSFRDILVAGSSIWFGQSWMRTGYVGIVVLLLALLGVQGKKRWGAVRPWVLFGVLGLMMSFGEFMPGISLFHKYVPIFHSIRYPVKYICFFYLALAVLAGFGAENIFETKMPRKKMLRFFLLFLFLLIVFLTGILLKSRFFELANSLYLHKLDSLEKLVFHHHLPKVIKEYAVELLFFAVFLCFLWCKQLFSRRVSFFFFSVLLISSIVYGTYRLEPVVPKTFYTTASENTHFLKANLQGQRYYLSPKSSAEAVKNLTVLPEVDFKEDFYKRQKAVLPNLGSVHHLATSDGYESIKLKNNEHIKNLIASRPLINTAKFLDFLGVKYILTFYPIKKEQFVLVRDDYIRFYQNMKTGKKVYFFDKPIFSEDEKYIDRILGNEGFDPLQQVIIHATLNDSSARDGWKKALPFRAEIIDDSPQRITVKTETSDVGWLVLADTYYPGWQAFINNIPTKIYRADYMARGVLLPKGGNEVSFVFRPLWFLPCAIISISSLLLMFHYIVRSFNKLQSAR